MVLAAPPDVHHNAQEHDELRQGFVVDFVALFKERLPSVNVGELLLDAHNVREVLRQVGRHCSRESQAAWDARREGKRRAFLRFEIDGLDGDGVENFRGNASCARRFRYGTIDVGIGAVLLQLGSKELSAVDANHFEGGGGFDDLQGELLRFVLLGLGKLGELVFRLVVDLRDLFGARAVFLHGSAPLSWVA